MLMMFVDLLKINVKLEFTLQEKYKYHKIFIVMEEYQ